MVNKTIFILSIRLKCNLCRDLSAYEFMHAVKGLINLPYSVLIDVRFVWHVNVTHHVLPVVRRSSILATREIVRCY